MKLIIVYPSLRLSVWSLSNPLITANDSTESTDVLLNILYFLLLLKGDFKGYEVQQFP